MTGPVLADIIDHSSIKEVAPGHWTEGTHAAWMAKDCPHCQRITKLCKAFREFGYTDLTIAEQREAYHVAMIRKPTAEDGIIAMMARSQLVEAGLIQRRSMTCGVRYYPQWSSRGIRAVRCTKPARFTVVDPPSWSADHVCGIHARVVRNYGGITVLDGIYDKNGAP